MLARVETTLHGNADDRKASMLILRALLNGVLGVVVLVAVTRGADEVFGWMASIAAFSHTISLGLGVVAAAATLFLMSRLQRQARNLSVGDLVVQNLLSAIFVGLFLLPIKS